MPTQATSRRDPRNTGKGISIHHGFTVIELMISLGVLAIITSLALPSYRTILEKRQVTSGAEQIKAFLSSAQLESVKRNQYVAVSYNVDGEQWCLGMVVAEAASNPTEVVSCNCMQDADGAEACLVDSTLRRLMSASLNYPEAFVTDSLTDGESFVYDPIRGMMANIGSSMNFEFLSVPEGHYALNVNVTPTGRVKICSDADRAESLVPGFDEC